MSVSFFSIGRKIRAYNFLNTILKYYYFIMPCQVVKKLPFDVKEFKAIDKNFKMLVTKM